MEKAMSEPGWENAENICDSNHQPTTTQEIKKLLVPTDYLWMLVEIGNIAPGRCQNWSAESSSGRNSFSATWFVEREGLAYGFDEVCFISCEEDKSTAGFNSRFIDKYRTEYFAMIGITEQYLSVVEWIDYDDSNAVQQRLEREKESNE